MNGNTDRVYTQDQDYSVPLPGVDRKDRLSAREMSWEELLHKRKEIRVKEQELDAAQALVIAQRAIQQPPTDLDQALGHLENMKREQRQRMNSLNAELQMRPALSCGCLFFVLVGCPVGIWFSRSDYLSAFITCFLPIVFLYYPIQLCMTGLAKDGKLHAALALWAADTAMGLIAVLLFRRLLKN
jgi:lipopolysaccharide export LptBFGC system permease protein LptF